MLPRLSTISKLDASPTMSDLFGCWVWLWFAKDGDVAVLEDRISFERSSEFYRGMVAALKVVEEMRKTDGNEPDEFDREIELLRTAIGSLLLNRIIGKNTLRDPFGRTWREALGMGWINLNLWLEEKTNANDRHPLV